MVEYSFRLLDVVIRQVLFFENEEQITRRRSAYSQDFFIMFQNIFGLVQITTQMVCNGQSQPVLPEIRTESEQRIPSLD